MLGLRRDFDVTGFDDSAYGGKGILRGLFLFEV